MIEFEKDITTENTKVNNLDDIKNLLTDDNKNEQLIFKKGFKLFVKYWLTSYLAGIIFLLLDYNPDEFYRKFASLTFIVPMFYAIVSYPIIYLHEHTILKKYYASRIKNRISLFSKENTMKLLEIATTVKENGGNTIADYHKHLYFPVLTDNLSSLRHYIWVLKSEKHNLENVVRMIESIDIINQSIDEFNKDKNNFLIKKENKEPIQNIKNNLIKQL